jgi:hypothetical protein
MYHRNIDLEFAVSVVFKIVPIFHEPHDFRNKFLRR